MFLFWIFHNRSFLVFLNRQDKLEISSRLQDFDNQIKNASYRLDFYYAVFSLEEPLSPLLSQSPKAVPALQSKTLPTLLTQLKKLVPNSEQASIDQAHTGSLELLRLSLPSPTDLLHIKDPQFLASEPKPVDKIDRVKQIVEQDFGLERWHQ